MFCQINVGVVGINSWFEKNRTREQALRDYVCPFLNKEITISQGMIFNMSSFGFLAVYATEKPIDSDWPVKKSDYTDEKGKFDDYKYQKERDAAILKVSKDITRELFNEAVVLVESGEYQELRKNVLDSEKGRYVFFVCPFDSEEVDHNYEYVIKPTVKELRFEIERGSDISHTRTINEVIIGAINKSRFIIADLSLERPNCYYEIGYAHALRKPVIILAKDGTPRHFDISHYKWNYWTDYKDLKPKLAKELAGVLKELGSVIKA